ncbi:hypothetical protein U14_04307 [Candidatus Moduliflexus flocculans]|uniref:Uncharacterized protein n=1 Tax=Candidatus Moduliflexus flocculans TaxID=1499966 RepID=A0A0S6W096_9BACT|nr:hypothetical protein U14_04307 [Candidatus Moduliflexus flocculans]
MEQDRGFSPQNTRDKGTLGQRWQNARPTKMMVFWMCLACVLLTMVVGFRWGGWVRSSTAQKMAETAADDAVIKRLTPICLAKFNEDPGKIQKYNELKAASSWDRNTYIEKQGWATIYGETTPARGVAAECAIQLMKAPAPVAAVIAPAALP